MSKHSMKLSLKEMYALKHSLRANITIKMIEGIDAKDERKEGLQKDIDFESRLLDKLTEEIESFKKDKNIK